MKRAMIAILLSCCLLLSGCRAVFDGSYVSVKPYVPQSSAPEIQYNSASNYNQLYDSLTELVREGTQDGVIYVADYDQDQVTDDMDRAVKNAMAKDPITAYAVENMTYELGKRNGQPALAVQIQYTHGSTELQAIKKVNAPEEVRESIANALKLCEVDIVLLCEGFEEADFVQIVEDYAMDYPQFVMELPQVNVGIYPETGEARVVALHFTYQTSRDRLKTMAEWVKPMFTSASLYVAGDAEHREKFSQLWGFLMERFDYNFETSITPAYSLLHDGVGDSRAFATVYGAMCRQSGLECLVVSGTRQGQSHYWNIVYDDGVYYHVDLLSGSFRERSDDDMDGYVWDYSAYPLCGVEVPKVEI